MQVALLTHNARAGDAIGNQVAEKLAFFRERGARVRVFVECDQRLHPDLRPHCCRLGDPEPRGEAWRFLISADLVIVEYSQYFGSLGLLPLLAKGKPRLLFDYHGVTPPKLWGEHNREALEQGARQRGLVWCADAALAHSRFTVRELQDQTGFPAERLHRLGHPIDTDRFCPAPPRRQFRHQLGLADASLVLFVGRVAPNKRVPVLVEALHRLRGQTPPVHLVVVGDQEDLYEAEAVRCRERAGALGVADRLHFLGHLAEDRLLDAYRSADVFVMPSKHEGFCIPLVEAMACGVPVVAARAGAMPETVAGAGLTFTPDDADDLARQLRRVLASRREAPGSTDLSIRNPRPPFRIAVVAFRYGTDFAGGAEVSLRTIGETLHQAGHHVEVFTTCTKEESAWDNALAEGTVEIGGLPVHRYRLDPHNRVRHQSAVRAILQADGPITEEVEREYLEHSLHSARLLEALRERSSQFDAIIVGPYLFGLTLDVAQRFPDKTLLVPCFHDEPLARLRAWREAYDRVGGILYHSPEEQDFAQMELGLSHPGAVCIGAILDTQAQGKPLSGRERVGCKNPYLVYCGRYSTAKNLPLLLEYARRYQVRHPERFTFAFLGQGDVPIPRVPWARDLGFVDESAKRDVLAGAAALVQLSRYESLSLVALEAWAEGAPVIADAGCSVLAGHLGRCGGGRTVGSYEAFADALDDLWHHPERWQAQGRAGRDYVRAHYGSSVAFTEKVVAAVGGLTLPLAERMRQRGLDRAKDFDRSRWRDRFGRFVERVLDLPPRPSREQVEVRFRARTRTVAAGLDTVLLPVRVINRGTHPAVPNGPARLVLHCRVVDELGQTCSVPGAATPLPGILLPGQALAAALPVPVPASPGTYQVLLHAEHASGSIRLRSPDPENMDAASSPSSVVPHAAGPEARLKLIVDGSQEPIAGPCCTPLLDAVQAALAEAERRHRLPDDYLDVTEGLLATWKRRLKRKLLGNFKHAYVDVLSRQQSAFNHHSLAAMQELAEYCATLDHALRVERDKRRADSAALRAALRRTEERLARLEAQISANEEVSSGEANRS
jgi:glycosyltransferase involved in cell wall biosynthesis